MQASYGLRATLSIGLPRDPFDLAPTSGTATFGPAAGGSAAASAATRHHHGRADLKVRLSGTINRAGLAGRSETRRGTMTTTVEVTSGPGLRQLIRAGRHAWVA